jgi:hypothetical protein
VHFLGKVALNLPFRAGINATGATAMQRRERHAPRREKLSKQLSATAETGKTFSCHPLPWRALKKHLFSHPWGKEGQKNVFPVIRVARTGKATFFQSSVGRGKSLLAKLRCK